MALQKSVFVLSSSKATKIVPCASMCKRGGLCRCKYNFQIIQWNCTVPRDLHKHSLSCVSPSTLVPAVSFGAMTLLNRCWRKKHHLRLTKMVNVITSLAPVDAIRGHCVFYPFCIELFSKSSFRFRWQWKMGSLIVIYKLISPLEMLWIFRNAYWGYKEMVICYSSLCHQTQWHSLSSLNA